MPDPDALQGPPSARLLDLTRLVSRVGRGPWTGVDRVEAAYLDRLLADPAPLFSLVKTALGFALFDRAGTAALAERLHGRAPWGAADGLSRLARKAGPARRAAESDLRRLALGRCRRRGLARLFARHLPPGTAWLNLGHSNLAPVVFDAIHRLPGGRATVLLHDTIPLDHPDWQRPGTVARFEQRMRAVSAGADLVICNSEATRADAARHFTAWGRVPPLLVAPLGVTAPDIDQSAVPRGIDRARPYFVALGTIEPRKNHALLLDIWEHFAATLPEAEIPALFIIGARGWANEAVFARLDTSPLIGRHVFEQAGLPDGAVGALLQGARALLMPSFAEGFGLPPAEALALGTPALVHNLPIYREILGNNPIYADVADMYLWATTIRELTRAEHTDQKAASGVPAGLPSWQEHFNLVLKVT